MGFGKFLRHLNKDEPTRPFVILVRGNLQRVIVPWAWFRPTPDGTTADFTDVEVVDDGLTIRLGTYEAAVEALLYEFDTAFRARERRRRLASDESFGASLRRLRLQRGVPRTDFAGVSEKAIARIERNEVSRPRGATLHAIAARLGVDPQQIGTF